MKPLLAILAIASLSGCSAVRRDIREDALSITHKSTFNLLPPSFVSEWTVFPRPPAPALLLKK